MDVRECKCAYGYSKLAWQYALLILFMIAKKGKIKYFG
jgi:hypothetical protein